MLEIGREHQQSPAPHPYFHLIRVFGRQLRNRRPHNCRLNPGVVKAQGICARRSLDVVHEIHMFGAVSMRTLYVTPGLAAAMPNQCCAVDVSPLLRELILHVYRLERLEPHHPKQRRLIECVLDQLEDVNVLPLRLPTPGDSRARHVAEVYLREPGDARTLDQACEMSGASKRTIERLFARETGMTFGRWRQQLRLIHALRLLASGQPVTRAALEAGYASPSAFTAMFKKALGCSPSRYFTGRPHRPAA